MLTYIQRAKKCQASSSEQLRDYSALQHTDKRALQCGYFDSSVHSLPFKIGRLNKLSMEYWNFRAQIVLLSIFYL